MTRPADQGAPLLRSPDAIDDLARAIKLVREKYKVEPIHLVAHSWGTIPAAGYAAAAPDGIASLTLFDPVVPVSGAEVPDAKSAWWAISPEVRYEQLRFKKVLPAGTDLLEPSVHARWAQEFATSSRVLASEDGTIRIPTGPLLDIADAQMGRYPHDAALIRAPVMVIYGAQDRVSNVESIDSFVAGFSSAPFKWLVRIDAGTHVLHLERNRNSLYNVVDAFIDQNTAHLKAIR